MEEEFNIRPELESPIEEKIENSLRPQTLDEYIGQTKVKENMKIYIEAAQKRGEPLDHCLFYGPPAVNIIVTIIIANTTQIIGNIIFNNVLKHNPHALVKLSNPIFIKSK